MVRSAERAILYRASRSRGPLRCIGCDTTIQKSDEEFCPLLFIKAEDSPNGTPLLVVSNEISGTVTLYEITK